MASLPDLMALRADAVPPRPPQLAAGMAAWLDEP